MCLENIKKINRKFIYGFRTLSSGGLVNVKYKNKSVQSYKIPYILLEKGEKYKAKKFDENFVYYGFHVYPFLSENRGYVNDFNEAVKLFKREKDFHLFNEICLVKIYGELHGNRKQASGTKMYVYKI